MSDLCNYQDLNSCATKTKCGVINGKCTNKCEYDRAIDCEWDKECYHDGTLCQVKQFCSDEPQNPACTIDVEEVKRIDCKSLTSDLQGCKSLFGCEVSGSQCTCMPGIGFLASSCSVFCSGDEVADDNRFQCTCRKGFYGNYCEKECKGEHKVVDNKKCVCEAGYNLDVSDNCIQCTVANLQEFDEEILACKCMVGAIDVEGACQCDSSTHYFPSAVQGCVYCDPTIYQYDSESWTCVCKDNLYGDNCELTCDAEHKEVVDGDCVCQVDYNTGPENTCIKCDESLQEYSVETTQCKCMAGAIEVMGICACDSKNNFYPGKINNCIICDANTKVYDGENKQCVCKEGRFGSDCSIECIGEAKIFDGERCGCATGYNEGPDDSCIQCAAENLQEYDSQQKVCKCVENAVMLENSCQCDASKSYSKTSSNSCLLCDPALNLQFNTEQDKCVCINDYTAGESGACELKSAANSVILVVAALVALIVVLMTIVLVILNIAKRQYNAKCAVVTENVVEVMQDSII